MFEESKEKCELKLLDGYIEVIVPKSLGGGKDLIEAGSISKVSFYKGCVDWILQISVKFQTSNTEYIVGESFDIDQLIDFVKQHRED